MNFNLTIDQQTKVTEWLTKEVYPKVIQKQKETSVGDPIAKADWQEGYPYEGAIGGGLTYEFTPTRLGVITKVRYGTEYELDITDYELW